MTGGNGAFSPAVSQVVKHWQIIVAVVGIIWVGSADAQQLKTANAGVESNRIAIVAAQEQYATIRESIGKVEGQLSVLIAQHADTSGTGS